ncbi:hypothetical protein COT68_03570 [bacterium (Candidatus Torokbacteria) CG09_land_8_20_14_0_10_42_11]|nr:MAG: hypothetical protein COT68_03570 [bacterium (Candidatus Torokbacteria) CG09_land_8_20_14_0_10_42_11]
MFKKQNKKSLPGIKPLCQESLDFFKKNFHSLFSLSLIATGIIFAFSFILGILGASIGFALSLEKQTPIFIAILCLFILLGLILAIAAYFFIVLARAVIILAILRQDQGKEIKIKKIWQDGFSQAKSVISLEILASLLVFAGYLLLFIPGAVFTIWFSFSIFVLLNENKKGRLALRRSKALVKGYFWPVAFRVFALSFLFALASLALSLIPFFGSIASMALGLFFLPLFSIYTYLIYKKLLIIKTKKSKLK